ncbi:hypothetical protein HK100_005302 [Physocladia obscura]|uniref:Uncharacterized protein n=1 Tax=Physocladia obscura TaxID=109957 RepID=A0AAD5SRT9_9FUNG|nr:hypothetical protein HK100_005302 [Physocladia obscura]
MTSLFTELDVEGRHKLTVKGNDVTWAADHPKRWRDQAVLFKLPPIPPTLENGTRSFSYSANLSSDGKLLAIIHNKCVFIFEFKIRELRQTLDGAINVHFKPSNHHDKSHYFLLTNNPSDYSYGASTTLLLWHLNEYGHLLQQDTPLDFEDLTAKTLAFLQTQLVEGYSWDEAFLKVTGLKSEIAAIVS